MTTVNTNPPAPHEVDQVVTALREQVLVLCAESARHPGAVRLSAHGVAVEVEWPSITAVVPGEARPPVVPEPALVPAAVPAAEATAVEVPATGPTVCAATVGTFYRAPEPGAKPFVSVGDPIAVGTQIGIIEAMKLMIPVEADRAGRIAEFVVEDGTAVEHGQPLLVLDPAS
ncbi:biotin/lipoyl-containing protein [Amycolatopsis rhabdoformis]|uniref:Biotin carboxyl carrier protein of acetyl-CoA carboxylase n=1 Tax=Amycolatopsis rhabdoformis TaxID=1448059 RepID=A0ABZ1IHU9_9PSEU|nr:biotin/lipoyl-containing protein [Amycolatopsis rhabdoformis]WSE33243.1 biotin/lipoyl-containing protein [Amycolatopsis rhabdoformis]